MNKGYDEEAFKEMLWICELASKVVLKKDKASFQELMKK